MRTIKRTSKNLDTMLDEMYALRTQKAEIEFRLAQLTNDITRYVKDELNPISLDIEKRTATVNAPSYQFHVAADIGTKLEDVFEALTKSRLHIDSVATMEYIAKRELIRKHPAIAKRLPVFYKVTSIRPR